MASLPSQGDLYFLGGVMYGTASHGGNRMTNTVAFGPGGYRYIPAVFQYSAGVAAEDGFELVRVRFRKPLPMADAFQAK
jgi:hypothetical protein